MPFGVGLEDFYRSGFGVDEKYLRVSRFMGYSLDVDAVAPDILFSSCPGLCSPAVLSDSSFLRHALFRLIHDTRSGLCVLDRRFLLLLESRLF